MFPGKNCEHLGATVGKTFRDPLDLLVKHSCHLGGKIQVDQCRTMICRGLLGVGDYLVPAEHPLKKISNPRTDAARHYAVEGLSPKGFPHLINKLLPHQIRIFAEMRSQCSDHLLIAQNTLDLMKGQYSYARCNGIKHLFRIEITVDQANDLRCNDPNCSKARYGGTDRVAVTRWNRKCFVAVKPSGEKLARNPLPASPSNRKMRLA